MFGGACRVLRGGLGLASAGAGGARSSRAAIAPLTLRCPLAAAPAPAAPAATVRVLAPRRHESLWVRLMGGQEKVDARKRKREEERQNIRKELTKGYFADLKDLKTTGGKRSMAPAQPCSPEAGQLFPALEADDLTGRRRALPGELTGKVSLVLLGLRDTCKTHTELYRTAFVQGVAGHMPAAAAAATPVQVLEIFAIERVALRPLRRVFVSALRKSINDPAREAQILYYAGSKLDQILAALGVHNPMVGFAYLTDAAGRIRWQAHSHPSDTELASMAASARALLEEAEGGGAAAGAAGRELGDGSAEAAARRPGASRRRR